MLLWVMVPVAVVPVGWWATAVVHDPARFTDAVAGLPAHPFVRRAIVRHAPVGRRPWARQLVGHLSGSTAATRLWRLGARAAHRRVHRPSHRAALVALAALGLLSTPHGRWRAAAWSAGIVATITTIWAVANL